MPSGIRPVDTGKQAPQTFPLVEEDGQYYTEAFGLLWPVQNDIALHLNCFRMGLSKSAGGLGKLRHCIEAHNLIWPMYAATINPWMIARFQAFCEGYKIVSLAGGSSTGKSHDAARFGLLWWWANPEERAVIISSTTVKALLKRAWAYVISCHRSARGEMPGIISKHPSPQILYDANDDLHGIHAISLKEGGKERSVKDIIGIHPKEALLVIVDECTDTPPAVLEEAQTNWDQGNDNFQMIVIGNSKSRFDPHGKFSEPADGWDSVHPDTHDKWKTRAGGVCLYFDCYKSPAILSPYKDRLKFLINAAKIEIEERRLGKDDPRFMRFVRGFWPPEDLGKTVVTLSLLQKNDAMKTPEWRGTWLIRVGALDPAFTSDGDECVLRFANVGEMTNGLIGIDFGGKNNIVSIKLDNTSREPVNYQILRAARLECEARGVKPEHFGLDSWGFGTGAGDIIQAEWSPEINRIISIGSPSDTFVDSDMSETCLEVYDRVATELVFSLRDFIAAGQVRGLDDEETIEQLCTRTWEWKGKKMSVEGKKAYKKRMGKEDGPTGSPDQMDAAAIVIEIVRRLGILPTRRADSEDAKQNWMQNWMRGRGMLPSEQGPVEEAGDQEGQAGWADPILDSESFSENDENF